LGGFLGGRIREVAKFPAPADVLENLQTVSRYEGATPDRISRFGPELMALPMVTTQMKKLGFELSNQNRPTATRQVLSCVLDAPAIGTINRVILRWTLNFEGSGEKLDRRRGLAAAELGISLNTFSEREADALDILTAILLSTTQTPCKLGEWDPSDDEWFKLKAKVLLELSSEVAKEATEQLVERLTYDSRRRMREPVVDELLRRFPRAAAVSKAMNPGSPDERVLAILRAAYAQTSPRDDHDDKTLTVSELRLSGTDAERQRAWIHWAERNGYEKDTELGRSILVHRYLQRRHEAVRRLIRSALEIEAADHVDGKAWKRALGLDPSNDRSLV
jgi:hypothetical protein